MTRADLCSAVAGIARVMARSPDAHAELVDAFLVLTESLAELSTPAPSRKQERVERLAAIESTLSTRPPAERMAVVMRDLGIGRSYYFEIRAAAIEQRLLQVNPVRSTDLAVSRTTSELD